MAEPLRLVTTRPPAQKVSGPVLDVDWTSFTFEGELERAVMEQHEGFTERERGQPDERWFMGLPHGVKVWHYPNTGRTRISGSPHKMVRGESVGTFGPDEMDAWASGISRRLGVDPEQVKSGRLRRLDIAANFVVSAPPCEYIALAESPPRMKRIASGGTTATFKNKREVEITLYDKIQKVRDLNYAQFLPADWNGIHVLRAEVRFNKVKREFNRVVTVGDLCNEDFWPVVADTYYARMSLVRFRRGEQSVPVAGDVRDLKDQYAARGIMAAGGLDVAIARIVAQERNGEIPYHQLKKQRKAIRDLVVSHAPGDADLAGEVEGLILQAVEVARRTRAADDIVAVAA